MEITAVQSSYSRWAPIYDKTFGAITQAARRRTVDYINTRPGRVLEVGVGTGLSLELYSPETHVTGIDYSDAMLQKARNKVQELGLEHVEELRQMDARSLDYPDNHFDTVTAMHVLSVVPEPEKVMAEIARVCKPGGEVVLTNHFERPKGFWAVMGRLLARFENILGWHSDFKIETVMQEPDLIAESKRSFPPFGMMTFIVLRKQA